MGHFYYAKYKGVCKVCRGAFSANARVYFVSPRKTLCRDCGAKQDANPVAIPHYVTPEHTPQVIVPSYAPPVSEVIAEDLPSDFLVSRYTLQEVLTMTQASRAGTLSLKNKENERRANGSMTSGSGGGTWWTVSPDKIDRLLSGEDTPHIDDSDTHTALDFASQDVKTRISCWDADDGELLNWDHLERNKALRRRRRGHLPVRAIEIDLMLEASSGVNAEAIDQVGVELYRAIRTLESMGVCVGITMGYYARRGTACGKNTAPLIRVKEPTEYLSPSLLSAVVTSTFLRTYIFAMTSIHVDQLGFEVDCALGKPAKLPFIARQGYLRVGTGDLFNKPAEEVMKYFHQAITGEVAHA